MLLKSPVRDLLKGLAQRRWPRPSRRAPGLPRKILLLCPNRLGDLVCALPAYRTLEINWPGARIDWYLGPGNSSLAPFLKAAGKIRAGPESRWRYWLSGGLVRELQAEEYDLCLAMKGSYDPVLAWISLASASSQRVGFDSPGRARLAFAYTIRVPPPPSHIHQVKKGLLLLQSFQLPVRSNDISLAVPPEATERIVTQMEDFIRAGFVVFQLSSVKRSFCHWPESYFVELGRCFVKRRVPVSVNAFPRDRAAAERCAQAIGPGAGAHCWGEMSDYLAYLKASRLVIGSDGGGIHLAAAVGVRTAAFYPESSPVRWKPWQGEHIQFYTDNRAVQEISADHVWQKLLEEGWLPEMAGHLDTQSFAPGSLKRTR